MFFGTSPFFFITQLFLAALLCSTKFSYGAMLSHGVTFIPVPELLSAPPSLGDQLVALTRSHMNDFISCKGPLALKQ